MSLSSFFRSILSKPRPGPDQRWPWQTPWSPARPPGFSLASPFQHSAGIPKRSCPQFWPVLQSRPVPLSCSTPSRGGAFGGHLGRFLFSEPQDRAYVLSCLWAPQGRMVPVEHASANKVVLRISLSAIFCQNIWKTELSRVLQNLAEFYRDLQNCAEKYRIRQNNYWLLQIYIKNLQRVTESDISIYMKFYSIFFL